MLVTIADIVQSHDVKRTLTECASQLVENHPIITVKSNVIDYQFMLYTQLRLRLSKNCDSKKRIHVEVTRKWQNRHGDTEESTEIHKTLRVGVEYRFDTMKYELILEYSKSMEYRVMVKERLLNREFNEDSKLTDVVLIAGTTKFHVNKAILAAQSSYFRELFFEHFGKSEVELKRFEPEDLQQVLQIFYHASDVDEISIENLLEVSKKHDLNLVTKKCNEFVRDASHLPFAKQARLSLKITNLDFKQTKSPVNFRVPAPMLTDVVLKVSGEKFHVNRATLAAHSSFFYSMFYSNFAESTKSEIELKAIDPEVLQGLLGVIYHIPSVNDDIVEDLLEAARMYDVKPATEQCQKFLKTRSWLSKEEKMRLAEEYELNLFLT